MFQTKKKRTSLFRKGLSIFVCLVMLLGMIPQAALPVFAASEEDPFTVVVSMEGLTLGQGLYFEPKAYSLDEINTLVKAETPYTKDTLTAGIATWAFMVDHGIEYTMTGAWEDAAYLSAVKGIDTGVLNIPAIITEKGGVSNEKNDGNNDDYLGEFDYNCEAGWMVTVNDFMIDTSVSDWEFANSENLAKYPTKLGNTYVVRWQFTLCGYGADLGIIGGTSWGMESFFTAAQKAELYAAFAASGNASKKADAKKVMENLTASQDEVNKAYKDLTGKNSAIGGGSEEEEPQIPEGAKNVTVQIAPTTVNAEFFEGTGASKKLDAALVKDNGTVGKYHEYVLSVPEGSYSYRAKDGEDDLGGMDFTVSAEESQSLTLVRTNFYTTNKAVAAIGDYTIEVLPGNMDPVVNGAQYLDSSSRVVTPTLLWANGNALLYNWTVTLHGSLADSYGVAVAINNTFANTLSATQNKTFTLANLVNYSILAPKGAKVQMFNQIKNFNVEEIPQSSEEAAEDGMVNHVFRVAESNNLTYRVSMEGKVTRAGYMGATEKTSPVVITFEENENPKDTQNVINGAGQNYAESSTLLNINGQNHLKLAKGDSYRIRAYRAAWQIVNSVTANIMIEPDFHYNVVSGAEHIQLIPAANRCTGNAKDNWMDVKGVSEGLAVVEVSYDALQIGGSGTTFGGLYGATDPNRTSLVVISVGGNSGALEMKAVGSDNLWDTEYDTVYTLEDTAKLSFTAALDGKTPTVELSTDKGANWTSLSAKDGVFTADKLVSGNNILKFTAGGKTAYQVVRAAKINYTLTNNSREGAEIKAGDQISLVFNGIYQPAAKFSGIYNPGFGGKPPHAITYNVPEGVTVTAEGGQYDFRSSNKYTITFGDAGTYSFTGGNVHFNIMGVDDPLGGHRVLTDAGVGANFSAVSTSHVRDVFPDLEFTVTEKTECEHVWGDCIVTKAHTAAKAGEKRYTCQLCGEYKYEATQKGACAKFAEDVEALAPTCTEAGHTAGTRCSECFKVLSGMEEIPATGHSFSEEWSKDENYHWHAATCGHDEEVDAKEAHTWDEGKTDGICKVYTCTVCEQTKSERLYKPILEATLDQLAKTVTEPAFGTGAGEWSVLALARGEYYKTDDPYFAGYYERVAKTVKETADSVNLSGALHKNKSTENSRVIIALSAIGKDATDVNGIDLVEAYSKNGFNWIKKQGINGPIFALIAWDTVGYEPSDDTLRKQCVDFILSKELAEGGWALSGTAADPDITSMALQALVAYKDDEAVAAAAERAIARLSAMQKEDGSFSSWGSANSESIAQVVTALSAWGIDADTDERFVKNGRSAIDGLLDYYIEEGRGFAHVLTSGGGYVGGEVNGMATDQAAYALVAYDRFLSSKTRLYDMTDIITWEQIKDDKDKKAAEAVDELIDAIGEVTLDSKDAIDKALEAYEALTPEQKELVTKKPELDAAIAEYERLLKEAEEDEKNKKAAEAVDELIDAIGEVTLDSKDAIDKALEAYEALTPEQKELVTKKPELDAAIAEYERLLKEAEEKDKPIVSPETGFSDAWRNTILIFCAALVLTAVITVRNRRRE